MQLPEFSISRLFRGKAPVEQAQTQDNPKKIKLYYSIDPAAKVGPLYKEIEVKTKDDRSIFTRFFDFWLGRSVVKITISAGGAASNREDVRQIFYVRVNEIAEVLHPSQKDRKDLNKADRISESLLHHNRRVCDQYERVSKRLLSDIKQKISADLLRDRGSSDLSENKDALDTKKMDALDTISYDQAITQVDFRRVVLDYNTLVLELKSIVDDGELITRDRIEELSKLKNRIEALNTNLGVLFEKIKTQDQSITNEPSSPRGIADF